MCSPYAPDDVCRAAAAIEPPYEPWFRRADPLRRELLLEIDATSLPGLLRYADRNSMAHSREVRLPFLDRRIVEFALGLPPDMLYDGRETKHVLRDAVRDVVPPAVLARRDKVGYETPQARRLSKPEAERADRDDSARPRCTQARDGSTDRRGGRPARRPMARPWRDLARAQRRNLGSLPRLGSRPPIASQRVRLVVASYYYPPWAFPAANRWAAMTKYLRRLGHDVTVVTTGAAVPIRDVPAGDAGTGDGASAPPISRPMLPCAGCSVARRSVGSRPPWARPPTRRRPRCSPR